MRLGLLNVVWIKDHSNYWFQTEKGQSLVDIMYTVYLFFLIEADRWEDLIAVVERMYDMVSEVVSGKRQRK